MKPQLASAGEDRPDAADHSAPAANADPFVINLCSSTTPMALTHPDTPELKRFRFFVSRRLEDGRERFRLHMGYFETLEEAEDWLSVVRDVYPGAWAGEAPGKRLRARARRIMRRRLHPRTSRHRQHQTTRRRGAYCAKCRATGGTCGKRWRCARHASCRGTGAGRSRRSKNAVPAAAARRLPPAPIANPPEQTAAPLAARAPVPPADLAPTLAAAANVAAAPAAQAAPRTAASNAGLPRPAAAGVRPATRRLCQTCAK